MTSDPKAGGAVVSAEENQWVDTITLTTSIVMELRVEICSSPFCLWLSCLRPCRLRPSKTVGGPGSVNSSSVAFVSLRT